MTASPDRPIGIFDSGIGGLTVAHAIKVLLPNEQLIYFGDTAHLPYGDKSEAAIQAYAVRIADVLTKKGCKVIVIACNSASSAAYELLKEYVRGIKIINVIDPMIQWVVANFRNTAIGLIGTRRTVQSGIYLRKLETANRGITLRQLPTPLLAPMIEEGFFSNQISHNIIDQYLSSPELRGISALILACTHYPLIREEIAHYYQDQTVTILDSSEVVALAVKQYLTEAGLLTSQPGGADQFLVSDYTESFEASTRLFFGEHVHLQEHPLWH
jgi:glutamate racemase